MARRKRRRYFGESPRALARQGSCSAARSAVSAMKPGIQKDYEAEMVDELCSISARGASFLDYDPKKSRARRFVIETEIARLPRYGAEKALYQSQVCIASGFKEPWQVKVARVPKHRKLHRCGYGKGPRATLALRSAMIDLTSNLYDRDLFKPGVTPSSPRSRHEK